MTIPARRAARLLRRGRPGDPGSSVRREWGAPVYVRHEIVHNRHVVERLERLGAVFVEELDRPAGPPGRLLRPRGAEVGAGGGPGSSDALSRRHLPPRFQGPRRIERLHAAGREIVLIGHAGHPEVIGTMGQPAAGGDHALETFADAEVFIPRDPGEPRPRHPDHAFVDDTAEMVATLQSRFPEIAAPHKEDIRYATTNRQDACVLARDSDVVLVIGLDEVLELGAPRGSRQACGRECGASHQLGGRSRLVVARRREDRGRDCGASAPEDLVEAPIGRRSARASMRDVQRLR